MDSTEPAAHLQEEPQSERGAPGSRDTGSAEPGGGPVDRPAGTLRRGQRHHGRPAGRPAPRRARPADRRPGRLTGREGRAMTMSPGDPGPTDSEGTAVPPYEGRRERADVDGEEKSAATAPTSGARPGRPRATSGRRPSRPTPRAGRSPRRPTSSRPRSPAAATRARRRSAPRTTPARPAARTSGEDEHDEGRGERIGDDVRRTAGSSSPGIGNVFRTDDGFGCEVVRRLAAETVAGRRPGGRLRHPRPAPGLRPARALGRAGDRRRAARPGRASVPSSVLEVGPDDVGPGRGRRARHGPGHRARPRSPPSAARCRRAPSSSAARSPTPATGWASRRPVAAAVDEAVRTVRGLVRRDLRPVEVV